MKLKAIKVSEVSDLSSEDENDIETWRVKLEEFTLSEAETLDAYDAQVTSAEINKKYPECMNWTHKIQIVVKELRFTGDVAQMQPKG